MKCYLKREGQEGREARKNCAHKEIIQVNFVSGKRKCCKKKDKVESTNNGGAGNVGRVCHFEQESQARHSGKAPRDTMDELMGAFRRGILEERQG